MWKYFTALVIVLALAVCVAVHDEHAAKDTENDSANRHKNPVASGVMTSAASGIAKPDENQAQDNAPDTKGYLSGLYGFFRWPNGTTTWAVILTLIVVADQTKQTARAARATERAVQESEKQSEISRKALVAQFRPRIEVRRIKLDPACVSEFDRRGDGIWEIEVDVINRGGTVAHIQMCEVSAYWEGIHPNTIRAPIGEHKWGACSVGPGDWYRFTLPIPKPDDFRISLFAAERPVASGKGQYSFPVCQGFISYRDDNGCSHDVAFDRDWSIKAQRFTPGDDPESEYSD